MRPTPFGYVFGEIADLKFPAIVAAFERSGGTLADRDQFVLLEPVGRLLREIVPEDASAAALESHIRLLHHAVCHWAAQGWVYSIGEGALQRALSQNLITSRLPRPALYLQLPELRVWGTPTAGDPPEPLDGMFVTGALPDGVAVLGIFGMRPDRPGFSALGLEGRADTDDASAAEVEVAAARPDGGAPFGPMLAGGTAAGLYSLANAGELLLLVCRVLAMLPKDVEAGSQDITDGMERIVPVE
jgi:hypothetical protein